MAADNHSAAGPAGDNPAGPAPSGWFSRARLAFRGWRHSRPFWGGLLALLGAAEIIASERAPLPIIIHLGAQGLTGYIVPVVMFLCALLIWFTPAQRIFYSILAILAALATFVTSNLGGFVIGMLLGIVGGSLAFAWVPGNAEGQAPKSRGRRRRTEPAQDTSSGLSIVFNEPPERLPAITAPLAVLALLVTGLAPAAGAVSAGRAHAVSARPVSPVATSSPAPTPSAQPTGTATPTVSSSPTGTPTPTVTPTPTPTPTPTVTPTPSRSPSPSPSLSVTPTPSPSPTPTHRPKRRRATAPAALVVGTSTASISAGTATMSGFVYDGVANVNTASGTTIPMLKFSALSMTLTDTALSITGNGQTQVTRNSSLTFTGNVTIYTTKFSADLLGIPLTYTPQNPPLLVLPLMTFTNMVSAQPVTTADSLQANSLAISFG